MSQLGVSRVLHVVDDEQIVAQPRLPHLVEGLCTVGGFVLLHAESGGGKTFLTLDLSLSVALNRPWSGRVVRGGPVVYIAAEGQYGLRGRVEAWKAYHGIVNRAGVTFVLDAIDPLQPSDLAALRVVIHRVKPVLIVLDTWSACLSVGGGDEDKAQDTGRAATALRRLANEVDAALWVVHHEGLKGKGRARGSTALKATADTALGLSKTKRGVIVLKTTKQRDLPDLVPMYFRLSPVALAGDESSAVLVPIDGFEAAETQEPLSKRAEQALTALRELPGATAGYTEWREAADIPDTTFRRLKDALVEAGHVAHEGRRYLVCADDRHDSQNTATGADGADPESPPPTVTPLRGDGSGCEGDGNGVAHHEPAAEEPKLSTIKEANA